MNNLKNKILIITALITGAVYFFNHANSHKSNIVESKPISNSTGTNAIKPTLPYGNKNKTTFVPVVIEASELDEFKGLNLEEKKSLITLSSIFAEVIEQESTLDLFVGKLADLKLKPIIMKDENAVTGTMNIVRTEKTLPGTRYVHAQYFTNKDETKFLQHISFELKGSNDSFEATKKIIQKQFNIAVKANISREDFISWNLDGRVIWIKKLGLDDMKENPFNSYNPAKDLGTIRIAIEAQPH